jgi:hypothetical protein
VRLVALEGVGWVPDERGRLDGPSVHVHCARACVLQARAEPPAPPIENGALAETLGGWLAEAVLDALSRVAAAGQVIAGHDVLRDALARDEIAALVFSGDAAARTRRSLEKAAAARVGVHTLDAPKEELGARIGQRPVAAAGVRATSAAAPLLRRLAMRSALRGERSG